MVVSYMNRRLNLISKGPDLWCPRDAVANVVIREEKT